MSYAHRTKELLLFVYDLPKNKPRYRFMLRLYYNDNEFKKEIIDKVSIQYHIASTFIHTNNNNVLLTAVNYLYYLCI